jgi:hypothetical protein
LRYYIDLVNGDRNQIQLAVYSIVDGALVKYLMILVAAIMITPFSVSMR